VVDSDKVFEIVGPAFNMVIGAFVGLLGGLSLNANARDAKPEEPAPVEPEPLPAPEPEPMAAPMAATPEPTPATEDDDDMAPWEKYRNDLRYDANGDGVVDEDDFPDWRNPRA
jgi:outer membrane biosynthesis protein TonB